jgi:hypothetical protein
MSRQLVAARPKPVANSDERRMISESEELRIDASNAKMLNYRLANAASSFVSAKDYAIEIAAAADLIESGKFAKLSADLAQAQAKAAGDEIALELAKLVGAYPNFGKYDTTVFSEMLLADVTALGPSVGAVEAACRKLRRTKPFVPAISEILEAIAEAHRLLFHDAREVGELPARIERARERHAQMVQREAKVAQEAERRERHLQSLKEKYGDQWPGIMRELSDEELRGDPRTTDDPESFDW